MPLPKSPATSIRFKTSLSELEFYDIIMTEKKKSKIKTGSSLKALITHALYDEKFVKCYLLPTSMTTSSLRFSCFVI